MEGDLNQRILPGLARQTDTRIVFVVLDGLGGALGQGPTALEEARHPNLDHLAALSALGRTIPVLDGITPGSGPGHFALFGYDPLEVEVGRGLLEALGLGIDVRFGDVAIRGNFCTVGDDGLLIDRRAGRIPSEQSAPLAHRLHEKIGRVQGTTVEVHPGLQHRFAMVFRGDALDGAVDDTDPQEIGVKRLPARARREAAAKTAAIADEIVAMADDVLRDQSAANGITLRGFSARPPIMTYAEMANLRACCVAAYPAYKGVALLLGMDVLPEVTPGSSLEDEMAALESAWEKPYDFFFLHVKGTDSAGEDGDIKRKARVIEEFDALVPRLMALKPDVVVVTGDHATPASHAAHSWHPVPTLLYGPGAEPDIHETFNEESCHYGRLGFRLPATALIRLALANAGKLAKFGA